MGLVWIVPAVGFLAILFAIWLAKDVLSRDPGTPAMQQVAGMIFEGAMAFLNRQYRTIGTLAVVTAVVIGILVGVFAHNSVEGILTGIAFILGALCSSVAGYIGMSEDGEKVTSVHIKKILEILAHTYDYVVV